MLERIDRETRIGINREKIVAAELGCDPRAVYYRVKTMGFEWKRGRGAGTIAERLEEFLTKEPGGCWVFTGARNDRGYGCMSVARKSRAAHRVAYEAANGPIPAGMVVCHKCDNPPCCNPAHLFLGTTQENTADMVGKSRNVTGDRVAQSKLTVDQVADIRSRFKRGKAKELGAEFGISPNHIYKLLRGDWWKTAAPLTPLLGSET